MPRMHATSAVEGTLTSAGARGAETPPGDDAGALARELQVLGGAVERLERQLDDLASLGGSLRQELVEEHARADDLESRVARLEQQIRAGAIDVADQQRLLAELGDLSHERGELANGLREFTRRIEDTRERQARLLETTEQLRAARQQDTRELHLAETQFERAADMACRVAAQQLALREQREELAGRLADLEATLQQATSERDNLLAEMGHSRTALERMQGPLADAASTPIRTRTHQ
jgi:chromosome segregation ATPase